jgi:hypothetical protein
MSWSGLFHCGFLGVDEWAELDPGQPPRVSSADPDVADPCADLNVVAVGGGSVPLHGSDDGSVGEEPNVDLADIQLVVGEEVVPVDPLLLVQQEALRADGQELLVDELAKSVPIIMELSAVESLLDLVDGGVGRCHLLLRDLRWKRCQVAMAAHRRWVGAWPRKAHLREAHRSQQRADE